MRKFLAILLVMFSVFALTASVALAADKTEKSASAPKTKIKTAKGTASATQPMAGPVPLDVTAEQSLEWYQEKHLYVARGKVKAIKGSLTVEGDVLTAHQREKDSDAPKPVKAAAANGASNQDDNKIGDIDQMTADGNVHITDPRQQIFGEHAVYDLDQHIMQVTGNNLKYLTPTETVTARDSLEYYELQNIAMARGNAVGIHQKTPEDRREVRGDLLTAQFTEQPDGTKELTQLIADNNVTVITKTDVSRGDHAVYDIKRNLAVLTGHVRITRSDTELAGDKAEVDFVSGHSRLLNEGNGRVRALMLPKPEGKTADNKVEASKP